MFIQLSGDRILNSLCIESIEYNKYTETHFVWAIRMVTGDKLGLTQAQYEELLSALPKPVSGVKTLQMQKDLEELNRD